jgi:hypothetical protein
MADIDEATRTYPLMLKADRKRVSVYPVTIKEPCFKGDEGEA